MNPLKEGLKLYRGFPIQVKASFWFFVCSLIQKAISIISTIIFTRLLSTADYGIISIYNSWSEILYIVATLNLATGVYNVGMTKFAEHRDTFNSSMQFLALIWTIGFSVVFFIGYRFIENLIQLPFNLVVIMFLTFLALPAYYLWSAKQRYENKYKALIAVTVSYSLGILIVSLISILLCQNKSEAKIISNAIVTMIVGFGLFYKNLKIDDRIIDKSYIKFGLKFNLPMIPAFLSMVILNQIDRIMISNMVGLDKAGIYSVAYNGAMCVSILSSAINLTYNPWMMQKVHAGDFTNVDRIAKMICLFFGGGLIIFMILAPEIIKIMATSAYYEAIYIIPPVAASTFFTLLYTFYCTFAQYFLKMKFLVLINVGNAVLNIVLNYVGISKWGYYAAGYTTYICYFLYGVCTALYVNCLIKKQYGDVHVYDNLFFAGFTVVLTVLMIAINYFYKGFIVRYAIIAGLLILLWKKRGVLINLIQSIRGNRNG